MGCIKPQGGLISHPKLERTESGSIQEATLPAPTQQPALLVKSDTSLSLAALLCEYNIDYPSASVFTMLYKDGFVERRFKAAN